MNAGHGFSVERRPTYLHVRVTGQNTGVNVRRYLADILQACSVQACSRAQAEAWLESDIGAPISSE